MPSSSAHFVGREEYMRDLEVYFGKRDDGRFTRRTCVLHGIGGVGKTQACLRFIEECGHLFSPQMIFWIDATSDATIEASLAAIALEPIAKKAGIVPNSNSVLQWLSSLYGEWLLVFDGADHEPYIISKFFPAMNRGNILISTRNPLMSSIAKKTIEVVDMSPTEAIELLLKSAFLSATSHSPETMQLAAEIAEELCYMPLAIDQAGAAIASCRTSLSGYLSLYKNHRQKLFGDENFKGQSKYDHALYTTWDISLNAIRLLMPTRPVASIAIFLLQIFSFMHYEGISEKFFERAAVSGKRPPGHEDPTSYDLSQISPLLFSILALDTDKQWNPLVFRDAIRLLLSYSFVKPAAAATGYYMHRLVHAWVRDRASPAEQTSSIYTVRALFELAIPFKSKLNSHLALCRAVLPHIIIHSSLVQQLFPDWVETSDRVAECMGEVYLTMGYYKEAMDHFQHVLRIQEDHQHAENVLLYTRSRIARISCYLGEYQRAMEIEEQVFEGCKRVLGQEHPNTLQAMLNLASTYHYLGEYQKAKVIEEQVLKERKKVLGSEHVATLQVMANLACTYRNLRQYLDAKELEEQVLEGRNKVLGTRHIDTLLAASNLAVTLAYLGEYQKAKEIQEQVFAARKEILGPEHPDTLWVMCNLACTYGALREHQKAMTLEEKVVESWKTTLGADHADTLQAVANHAYTCAAMGNCSEAERLLRDVIDKERKVLGPDHPRTVCHIEGLQLIGQIYNVPFASTQNHQKNQEKISIMRKLRQALVLPRKKT